MSSRQFLAHTLNSHYELLERAVYIESRPKRRVGQILSSLDNTACNVQSLKEPDHGRPGAYRIKGNHSEGKSA